MKNNEEEHEQDERMNAKKAHVQGKIKMRNGIKMIESRVAETKKKPEASMQYIGAGKKSSTKILLF